MSASDRRVSTGTWAVPAYKGGFRPDSISTDLHTNSMNGGMKNINNMMSDIMALGSSVADVVR